MGKHKYIDFDLVRKIPNKYNLTPGSIKKLKIKDWDKLKKETGYNQAKKNSGTWWCHLEGCNPVGKKYDDENEFWIGFNEDNDEIDCYFTCYSGMCKYVFEKFYNVLEIENKYDMQIQANTIRWLNKMIDNGILGEE